MSTNKMFAIILDMFREKLVKALEILENVKNEGIQCYNSCAKIEDLVLQWDIRVDLEKAIDLIADVISKIQQIV